MVDLYFKIKLISGAVIIGLLGLLFSIGLTVVVVKAVKGERITRYFSSVGYTRISSSFGCGYKRHNADGSDDIVKDSELNGLSVRQIKKKYKRLEEDCNAQENKIND